MQVKIPDLGIVQTGHEGRELDNGHDSGECGLLDRGKRLVEVETHVIGHGEEVSGCFWRKELPDCLDERLLRVPYAEIEADGLKNQTFKANDQLRRPLERLR
jgi:hypothetical protein